VVELGQGLIVQEGDGAQAPVRRRQDGTVHQGPVGIDEPGVPARHQGAQQALQEHQTQQETGAARPAGRRATVVLTVPGLQSGPDQGGEQDQGQTQMGRQTFGCDTDPLGQTA